MHLATTCALLVQAAAFATQSFEVATIRPFVMPQSGGNVILGKRGGPGTPDPERIGWSGATLNNLLMEAYDVKAFQIGAPEWVRQEGYNIVAKVPKGASKEQVKLMWQNLLADRFGVVFHREQKDFSVQELTVVKNGPKLKETDLDPNAPPAPLSRAERDVNGDLKLPQAGWGITISYSPSGSPIAHLTARAMSMDDFAGLLGSRMNLDKPVLNKTGLTGKYDFSLEYAPKRLGAQQGETSAPGDAPEPGSDISGALQKLGLKLALGKTTLDVLVIDKAAKEPTGS